MSAAPPRVVRSDTPYGRAVAVERARLEKLLDARTLPDGRALPGLRSNVAEIQRRLATLPVIADDHG